MRSKSGFHDDFLASASINGLFSAKGYWFMKIAAVQKGLNSRKECLFRIC